MNSLSSSSLGRASLYLDTNTLLSSPAVANSTCSAFPGRTQQNADGLIVPFGHFVFLEVVEVEVELSDMGVFELFGLQFDQHMTFQYAVIKDQIDKIMLVVDGYPLLSGFETEAFPSSSRKCWMIKKRL